MITAILVGCFAIFFATLSRFDNTRWGLNISFIIIFIYLAIRYNFGNDYAEYFARFYKMGNLNQIKITDVINEFEPGWYFINWIFQDAGFFTMVAVLAVLNCIIYYNFIKTYVPRNYYWFAVFIYIFYPDFMLVHASTMRQSIAIMLFVYSFQYLKKKNCIKYFIIVSIASSFHFTALILLPTYLLVHYTSVITPKHSVIMIFTFLILLFTVNYLSPIIKPFIGLFSEKYEFYQEAGALNTGMGFIYYFLLFVIIVVYEKFQDRNFSILFKISIIGFMFMPLTLVVEMISRLGMYFTPATIVVYPILVSTFKNKITRLSFIIIFISITLYQFIQFFNSETYKTYYDTYQTIFSAPRMY